MKGAEREVVGVSTTKNQKASVSLKASKMHPEFGDRVPITAPATPEAQQWDGWGTALKPSWEPVIVARKPLIGTVAENVLRYGTGAMNIDGCRVETNEDTRREKGGWQDNGYVGGKYDNEKYNAFESRPQLGRWPANLIHDGSDEVLALFPETKAGIAVNHGRGKRKPSIVNYANHGSEDIGYGDSGSAARFFYCPKASKKDRDEGCEGLEERGARPLGISQWEGQTNGSGKTMGPSKPARNHHPTVKPEPLMRYLCKLVTPPGGIVFDPFMGSGSTGKAAIKEGFRFFGCDTDPEYVQIAEMRTRIAQPALFTEARGK